MAGTIIADSIQADTGSAAVSILSNTGTTVATFGGDGQLRFVAGSASVPAIAPAGDLNTGIFFPAADTIAFTEGGVESMRIDSAGNVGIGTSSPKGVLDVTSAGAYVPLFLTTTNTANSLQRNWMISTSWNLTGDLSFVTSNAIGGNPVSAGTTRMMIDAVGNVGIGTTSPNALLDAYTTQGGSRIAATHGTGGSYPKASGISFGATQTSLSVSNNGGTTTFIGGAGIYANNTAASNNPTDLVFWTTSGGVSAERARITAAGLFQFNSGYGSVATAYGCRAWVNFNGTGTVAIRASGNVSSITDNNTGDYTVNFTNAMPDANYSLLGTTSIAASTENPRVVAIPTHLAVPTASAARILTRAGSATSGTGNDTEYVYIAIFR